jgi:NAD(P)-dependent dehydrogenase (short-subunit alcohol dehydrogenase family)
MNEPSNIEGKSALVTGSSRNLGAEIARELARRGARVAVNFTSSKSEAEALVSELSGMNNLDHKAFKANLAASGEAAALCESARSEFGAVDILINNAGPFAMDPFTELKEAEWDRIWNVNVKAAYLCAKSLAPQMSESGWGRIVNVSAGSAYIRNHSIYTLAKEALITLTEELALELGPNINVNAVAPGQIAESAADIADFDPTFVDRAISWTPLGRLATRREVARIVVDLCDTRYDVVTGATIPIDGGWRLNRF